MYLKKISIGETANVMKLMFDFYADSSQVMDIIKTDDDVAWSQEIERCPEKAYQTFSKKIRPLIAACVDEFSYWVIDGAGNKLGFILSADYHSIMNDDTLRDLAFCIWNGDLEDKYLHEIIKSIFGPIIYTIFIGIIDESRRSEILTLMVNHMYDVYPDYTLITRVRGSTCDIPTYTHLNGYTVKTISEMYDDRLMICERRHVKTRPYCIQIAGSNIYDLERNLDVFFDANSWIKVISTHIQHSKQYSEYVATLIYEAPEDRIVLT